jgi:hypothetical protein
MAQVVRKRLLEHLEHAGFVVTRRPTLCSYHHRGGAKSMVRKANVDEAGWAMPPLSPATAASRPAGLPHRRSSVQCQE